MNFKEAKLLESWAKSPFLNNKKILIVGECLKNVYPEIYEKFAKGKIALKACPETEQPIFGKLASMLTSTKPRSITVLTIDCSPHCYELQAAVNEAFYIGKIRNIPKKHYVVLNGKINEISPEAIRLSRYLTLTQKAIKENPRLIDELKKYSLEQKSKNKE